jgi:hypothetical protein
VELFLLYLYNLVPSREELHYPTTNQNKKVMDRLDALTNAVEEANTDAERLAYLLEGSTRSDIVSEITEGDQVTDPSVRLDVPDAENVRLNIEPDGSVTLWEGYGIEKKFGSSPTIGEISTYLEENYL